MKKSFIVLPFLSLFIFMMVSFGFVNPGKKKFNHAVAGKGFAVVELFTSEGCSSCPPADEAVAALAKEYPLNVYILGFHVDYWNYLGWKDVFSSASYSARQQDYGTALQLNSVYTPQVVVNGKTECTGSDTKKLHASVEAALSNDNGTILELTARAAGSSNVLVTCTPRVADKSILNIALIQLQATSTVQRGENKGKLLHHVNVVRSFKTVAGNAGSISLGLPEGLAAKDCKVIAFVQNSSNLSITGAGECIIK